MEMLHLVKQAQNGDETSFGLIYDEFADSLFRYIKLKVQNQQQAEDLLQETFIKAWRALPKLKADESLKFKSWLYTVAANCVNDHYRKVYAKPENLELNENIDVEYGSSPEKEALLKSDIEILKKAVLRLPKQYQEILELRFISDFTLEECEKILKKNSVSVRVLQYRALKKLKTILDKDAILN